MGRYGLIPHRRNRVGEWKSKSGLILERLAAAFRKRLQKRLKLIRLALFSLLSFACGRRPNLMVFWGFSQIFPPYFGLGAVGDIVLHYFLYPEKYKKDS